MSYWKAPRLPPPLALHDVHGASAEGGEGEGGHLFGQIPEFQDAVVEVQDVGEFTVHAGLEEVVVHEGVWEASGGDGGEEVAALGLGIAGVPGILLPVQGGDFLAEGLDGFLALQVLLGEMDDAGAQTLGVGIGVLVGYVILSLEAEGHQSSGAHGDSIGRDI